MYHHSLAFLAHMLVPHWGISKQFPKSIGLAYNTTRWRYLRCKVPQKDTTEEILISKQGKIDPNDDNKKC